MISWAHRPLIILKRKGKVTKAPFYSRYANMLHRCYGNGKHRKWYRDRGITVCEEWRKDFWAFYDWCVSTYEHGKTLDRIDNDGNYSPENCRWATQKEQMNNSRKRTPDKLKAAKTAKVAWRESLIKKFGNPKTRTKKICCTCRKTISIDNFHKNKKSADGLVAFCKVCSTITRRKYYKNASDSRKLL